ncbi:MAG: nucleotidyltransferase [Lentisphaerae bacterium]|nr:nucleotidyltransferase [Lentisphaerota bacterium]
MHATVLILAAGMGSRYGGLKQVDPVGPDGETLMDYAVFDALRAGFDRIVFVIRRDFAEVFKRQVAARYASRIAVDYAYQDVNDLPAGFSPPPGRDKPWGTAHAVRAARAVVREPFAVINADDFYDRDAYAQLAGFFSTPAPTGGKARFAMVGYTLRATLSTHGTVSRGVCRVGADGMLADVTEMTQLAAAGAGVENRPANGPVARLSGDEAVSMNFWGFTPRLFDILEDQFPAWLQQHGGSAKDEWYIPFVVADLIRRELADVQVLRTDGVWQGLTYRAEHSAVAARLLQFAEAGHYPRPLWG